MAFHVFDFEPAYYVHVFTSYEVHFVEQTGMGEGMGERKREMQAGVWSDGVHVMSGSHSITIIPGLRVDLKSARHVAGVVHSGRLHE